MPAPVKYLFILFLCLVQINVLINPARADYLDDAFRAYSQRDYKKAIILLEKVIAEDPDNASAYNLLGKSYEETFEIGKALKAYKQYEILKRKGQIVVRPKVNISPLPDSDLLKESASPPPIDPSKPLENMASPSVEPMPSPGQSPDIYSPLEPLPSVSPSPSPAVTPSPIQELTHKNKPDKIASASPTSMPAGKPKQPELDISSEGWEHVQIIEFKRDSEIDIIEQQAIDLKEVSLAAEEGYEFISVTCHVIYNEDIILKKDANQILLTDFDDNQYNFFAMSTYIFQYDDKTETSKKVRTLLTADYYQLSTRDHLGLITFVFKVPEKTSFKELQVLGYKNLTIKAKY